MRKGINILDLCEISDLKLRVEYIQHASRTDYLWACGLETSDHGPVGIETGDGAWTSFTAYGNNPLEAVDKFVSIARGKELTIMLNQKIKIPHNLYIEYDKFED